MKAPHLDERLAAAASLVIAGKSAADIGCDHGKLTAYLAASGICPHVIGADLRPGPLAKAEKTLERTGTKERCELRLGDGLSVLRPGEAATVIIAGVSAQTAIDMLQAAPWIKEKDGPRLVLVPATKHEVLRHWLAENGYTLLKDIPAKAAGRWYAVMAAEYTGEARTPALRECLYGRTAGEPGGAEYCALQLGRMRKVRTGLAEDDPMAAELDALLREEEEKNNADAEGGI